MNQNKIIKINGQTEFMGITIPIIEGGFGENQKCVLAKDISIIHEKELKDINKNIKRLIDKNRIKNNLHYIDLLEENFEVTGGNLEYKTSNGQKNAYVLSERGYISLIKYMDDDKSWEVMDKFVDEYFNMRKVINSDDNLKANLLLNIYKGGQDGILASKQLADLEVKEAVKPLNEKIEEDRPFVSLAKKRLDKNGLISITDANKTFERKRGEITKWAKSEGYLHKTNVEVNNKGEEYFRVYDSKGYRCIGVTEKGLTLIDEHFKSAS